MRSVAVVASAVLLAAVSLPRGADAADAGAGAVPACVSVHAEARYVPYGYNHLVFFTSTCQKDATCKVSTNVNPAEQTVEVPAGKSAEVTTYMGSPAREFTPRVACTLH